MNKYNVSIQADVMRLALKLHLRQFQETSHFIKLNTSMKDRTHLKWTYLSFVLNS